MVLLSDNVFVIILNKIILLWKVLKLIEDPEYTRKMRNTVTFGGAPEIRASCNIWNIKIIVYINSDHSKQIDFIPINNCILN